MYSVLRQRLAGTRNAASAPAAADRAADDAGHGDGAVGRGVSCRTARAQRCSATGPRRLRSGDLPHFHGGKEIGCDTPHLTE